MQRNNPFAPINDATEPAEPAQKSKPRTPFTFKRPGARTANTAHNANTAPTVSNVSTVDAAPIAPIAPTVNNAYSADNANSVHNVRNAHNDNTVNSASNAGTGSRVSTGTGLYTSDLPFIDDGEDDAPSQPLPLSSLSMEGSLDDLADIIDDEYDDSVDEYMTIGDYSSPDDTTSTANAPDAQARNNSAATEPVNAPSLETAYESYDADNAFTAPAEPSRPSAPQASRPTRGKRASRNRGRIARTVHTADTANIVNAADSVDNASNDTTAYTVNSVDSAGGAQPQTVNVSERNARVFKTLDILSAKVMPDVAADNTGVVEAAANHADVNAAQDSGLWAQETVGDTSAPSVFPEPSPAPVSASANGSPSPVAGGASNPFTPVERDDEAARSEYERARNSGKSGRGKHGAARGRIVNNKLGYKSRIKPPVNTPGRSRNLRGIRIDPLGILALFFCTVPMLGTVLGVFSFLHYKANKYENGMMVPVVAIIINVISIIILIVVMTLGLLSTLPSGLAGPGIMGPITSAMQ